MSVDFEKNFTYFQLRVAFENSVAYSRLKTQTAKKVADDGFCRRNPTGSCAVSLQNKKKDERLWAMRQVGLLTTIPVLLAVSPVIGFFMGQFIDGRLNTNPVFSILFLILGFAAGARQVAKVVRLANKEAKKKDDDRAL